MEASEATADPSSTSPGASAPFFDFACVSFHDLYHENVTFPSGKTGWLRGVSVWTRRRRRHIVSRARGQRNRQAREGEWRRI